MMERQNKYQIKGLEDLSKTATRFVEEWLSSGNVFAFYAPMGTGKTTFIKAVCECLKVEDVINSPTFSIINEYYAHKIDDLVYHFDCYRLKNEQDAINIGVEDYFASGRYCFIEWPEVLEQLMPENTIKVIMSETESGMRLIEIEQG